MTVTYVKKHFFVSIKMVLLLFILLSVSSCKYKSKINSLLKSTEEKTKVITSNTEKILPGKDINSPVRVMEKRVYYLKESIQDGVIVAYDKCGEYNIKEFNKNGYLTHETSGGYYTDKFEYKYKIDLSDKKYTYIYINRVGDYIQKKVYNAKGKLYKKYIDNKLSDEYKYDKKDRLISIVNYNYEGAWCGEEKCHYNNIKTTSFLEENDGKKITYKK